MRCDVVLRKVADDGGLVEGLDAQAQVVDVAAFVASSSATATVISAAMAPRYRVCRMSAP